MATLQISPQALSDLQDIKQYIDTELENPTAAENTVHAILKAIRHLASFPAAGAPLSSIVYVHTDYRFVVSGNYLVFYRHHQRDDAVYIVRVLYGKRDYLKVLFE